MAKEWPRSQDQDGRFGELFVEYDLYTAAAVMTIIPVLVIYLVLQRFIIEGIATQGLKG